MNIETPIVLERLDNDNATFAGSANETKTLNHPLFGDQEVEMKYPLVMLQREVWESLGRPTSFGLVLKHR